MKHVLEIFCFLVLMCFFSACDEDETMSSKAEFLSSGTGQWKMVGYISESGSNTNDIFGLLEPCEHDDLSRFKKGGNFEFLGGTTKCDPDENAVLDGGTWELISNDTQLRFF